MLYNKLNQSLSEVKDDLKNKFNNSQRAKKTQLKVKNNTVNLFYIKTHRHLLSNLSFSNMCRSTILLATLLLRVRVMLERAESNEEVDAMKRWP